VAHADAHRHDAIDLPEPPLRLRRWLTVSVACVTLLAVVAMVVWWPRGDAPDLYVGGSRPTYVDATVTLVRSDRCPGIEDAIPVECDLVEARLEDGRRVEVRLYGTDPAAPSLERGDEIVLLEAPTATPEFRWTFADFQRDPPLLVLGVLFVVAVVAFGRWQGVRALAGIVVSFAVLLVFLLPALLRGSPALPVALAGTVLIAVAALYVTHGLRTWTTVALLGTLVSLVAIAGLALVFVEASRLTGFVDEDAQVLRITAGAVDLRGLLIAGMVIGALGVLDDVTVTQVSAVGQLRRANPGWSRRRLYRSAVTIGRDHIASTVNTLVLAYAGASLPLLLLFVQGGQPLGRLLTGELVAIEIVRTLVGSIGLVLAVPVTTGLAAVVLVDHDDGPAEVDDTGPVGTGPGGAGPGDDQPWDGFTPEPKPF
jgi:uncharacterized membrane protein